MNTNRHRSEGVAKKPAVTQRVKDFFHKNLSPSVCICGINSFCQPNRGKNLKMPKMPKSVQFSPEPDFLTPPVVPPGAGFAAGRMGQTGVLPIMFISSSQHHIFLRRRGRRQLLQRNWQNMRSLAWREDCSFDKILRMTLMRFITKNACP